MVSTNLTTGIILLLFVWISMAAAVALHADENDKDGRFWGVITLVSGVFGVLLYVTGFSPNRN